MKKRKRKKVRAEDRPKKRRRVDDDDDDDSGFGALLRDEPAEYDEEDERDEDDQDDDGEDESDSSAVEGEIVDGDTLTAREATIVREYVVKGRVVFFNLRWDAAREVEFLQRRAVQDEIRKYEALTEYGEQVIAKQAFLGTVDLGNMVPEAISIIKRHLRGLLPDANGNKQKVDDLPDSDQVETAWQILHTVGVGKDFSKQLVTAGITLELDNPALGGGTEKDRYALSEVMKREKVRNVLNQIAGMSAAADDAAKKLLSDRIESQERKAARKKVKNRAQE